MAITDIFAHVEALKRENAELRRKLERVHDWKDAHFRLEKKWAEQQVCIAKLKKSLCHYVAQIK